MKLAMEHLSKQFKNKIAVKHIDTILTEGIWFFGCKWCRKDNAFTNDLWNN